MTDIQYDSRNIPIGTIGNSDHLSGSNGLSDYTTPTSYQPYQPTDSEATSSDSTKVFSSTSLYLKSSRYSEPQTTTLDDVTKQHSETPQETDSNEVTPSNVNKNGVDAAYTHQGIDANYGLHNTSIQTNEENNNIQLEQNNAVINNVTSNIDDNSVPSNVAVTDMNNGVPSSDIPNQSSTTGAHTAVSPSPPYMANDINNTAPIMGSNGIASTSVPSNNQAHEPTPVMNAPQNNNMQQNSFNTNTSVMTQQPITNGTTVTSSVNSGPPMTMSQKADPERNHPNNSLFIEHIKDMHNKAVEQVRHSVQIQQQNAPVNQMHQQPQMQYPQQQQQQQQQPQQLHQQQQQPLPLQQHPQIQQQQQPQIQQHQQPYMQPQIHQHQHQIAQQPQYQHPQPVEPVREIYQPQPTSQFQNRQQNHQPNVYVPSTQQTPVYYQNNSNNVVGEAQPKRLPQQNQGYEMVGPRGIDETLKIPLAMSNPISEDIFNESQSFGTQIKTLQDHLHSNQDGMSEQRFRSTIEKYIDEIRKSYLVVVKNSSQMQKKIDAQNEKIIELQQQIISAKSERIDTETNLRTKLEEKEKMVNQLEKDLVQEKERIITKLIQQEDNAKERGLSRASTPSENEFDHCRSPQQKMNDENDRQDHQHQQQFKSGLPVHRKLSAASKPPTIHKKKEDKEVSNEDKQPTTCSFPLLMNPMYPSQKLDGEPFKEVTKRITNVLHTIGHKIEFDCMKPSKNGGVIIFFVSYQHRNIAKAALENTVLQLKMKPVVLSPGELYGYYRPDNLVNKDRSSRSASPVRLATYRGKV